jgi:hypothetical protein
MRRLLSSAELKHSWVQLFNANRIHEYRVGLAIICKFKGNAEMLDVVVAFVAFIAGRRVAHAHLKT